MIIIVLSGCSTTSRKSANKIGTTAHFTAVSFSELEGWQNDEHEQSLAAFLKSCKPILNKKDNDPVGRYTKVGGKAKYWKNACRAGMRLGIGDVHDLKGKKRPHVRLEAKKFFEKYFTPYKVGNSHHGRHLSFDGKYTGYYEIELHGTKKKNPKFLYAIYAPPKNLKQLKNSHSLTRNAIHNGSLKGKGYEIAWVDDLPRLHYLHMQGTGTIRLREGGEMPLAWAGSNGFSCTALPSHYKGSAINIMNQLKKNPDSVKDINSNKSHIFFQERKTPYPVGAQNVMLTPERSIAIDRDIYPYGVPLWVQTTVPYVKGYNDKLRKYNRLFIAQDRGGGIYGSTRGDIFWGKGRRAEHIASGMIGQGKMFALFPKEITIPKIYN